MAGGWRKRERVGGSLTKSLVCLWIRGPSRSPFRGLEHKISWLEFWMCTLVSHLVQDQNMGPTERVKAHVPSSY
eukprot:2849587-Amphidinium_carterae.1